MAAMTMPFGASASRAPSKPVNKWLVMVSVTFGTLMGAIDNTAHSFVADENTTFRKRRDPITLADIQVGDTVRVEGAVKDGAFLATQVSAMGQPPAGAPNAPRNGPPPTPPPQ